MQSYHSAGMVCLAIISLTTVVVDTSDNSVTMTSVPLYKVNDHFGQVLI